MLEVRVDIMVSERNPDGTDGKGDLPVTATAKVTTKGQITVPIEIRKRLNLQTGDEVLFVYRNSRVYVERIPSTVSADEVFGLLAREGEGPLDLEAAREQVRARRYQRYQGQPPETGQ